MSSTDLAAPSLTVGVLFASRSSPRVATARMAMEETRATTVATISRRAPSRDSTNSGSASLRLTVRSLRPASEPASAALDPPASADTKTASAPERPCCVSGAVIDGHRLPPHEGEHLAVHAATRKAPGNAARITEVAHVASPAAPDSDSARGTRLVQFAVPSSMEAKTGSWSSNECPRIISLQPKRPHISASTLSDWPSPTRPAYLTAYLDRPLPFAGRVERGDICPSLVWSNDARGTCGRPSPNGEDFLTLGTDGGMRAEGLTMPRSGLWRRSNRYFFWPSRVMAINP